MGKKKPSKCNARPSVVVLVWINYKMLVHAQLHNVNAAGSSRSCLCLLYTTMVFENLSNAMNAHFLEMHSTQHNSKQYQETRQRISTFY